MLKRAQVTQILMCQHWHLHTNRLHGMRGVGAGTYVAFVKQDQSLFAHLTSFFKDLRLFLSNFDKQGLTTGCQIEMGQEINVILAFLGSKERSVATEAGKIFTSEAIC